MRHWQQFLHVATAATRHPTRLDFSRIGQPHRKPAHGGPAASTLVFVVCSMAGQATGAATTDGSAQPSSAKTHYDILGVSRTATCEEIKAAYHNLARQTHPDKVSSNGSQDSFRRLQSAWECLRQAETRQAYDEQLFLKEQKLESKRQAAMTLSLSELEVGHDDESDEHVYIYTCRCGEELQIWQDEMPPLNESFLTECSGCSFSYSVMNDLFK
jgi:hypothetical protein